jgi:hypothetical protein
MAVGLKPEYSVMGGLAVGAIVFAIHSNATPSMADIQALPAGTPDIDRAEKNATIMSAGVVAGISLIARDPGIFIIGSVMAIGMAWWTRNSNWMESVGGKYLTVAEEGKAGSANTGPAAAETAPYEPFQNEYAR